jgi:hypothetical protein
VVMWRCDGVRWQRQPRRQMASPRTGGAAVLEAEGEAAGVIQTAAAKLPEEVVPSSGMGKE